MVNRRVFVFSGVLVIAAASPASAAFLDTIKSNYDNATASWLDAALVFASAIFAGLIVLELAWSLTEIFLRSRDIDSFLNSLIMRIIGIGSGIFLLTNAHTIVTSALADFVTIGSGIANSSGTVTATSPDAIFMQGYRIAEYMIASSQGIGLPGEALLALPQDIGALLVLVAYALVAAQLLLTEIQIDLVIGAGAFLLGFIGSRWTLPFAESYPRMLVASGSKLVAILLVVGLGNTLAAHFIAQAQQTGSGALAYLTIGASALIYGLIAWNLPALMQAFAAAAPILSASGIAGATAGAVASAVRAAGSGGSSAAGDAARGGANSIASIEKATRTD